MGGCCPELKIFWRYALDPAWTVELKRKAIVNKTSGITIYTPELDGMVVPCWVVQVIAGYKPNEKARSFLMRGDKVSAVSWVNRCGCPRDRHAGLAMRLLGHMEIQNGRCHVAKHIRTRSQKILLVVEYLEVNRTKSRT